MSDSSTTPNYGFIKPTSGADDDVWGDHLNQNADALDTIIYGIDTRPLPFVQTAGDTMTGPLNLPNGTSANPSLAFGAVDGTGWSRSVNALVLSVQGATVLGTFAGSWQAYAPLSMLNNRITQLADATAAGDALNQRSGDARYMATTAGPFVAKAGDTMTGPLMLPAGTAAAPGLTLGTSSCGVYGVGSSTAITSIGTLVANFGLGGSTSLVPLSMNNQRITSVANATAATDALNQQTGDARYQPIGATAGVASWNTRTGAVTLTTADITAAGGAPLNAPAFTGDAQAVTPAVGDNDTSIATTAFVQAAAAPAQHNVGRNLLHNPLFNVAQRGVGPFTAAGYTLDRWTLNETGDANSVTANALTDAGRAMIGDEAGTQALFNVFTGTAGASAISYILQPIEGMRRLSGKTVTVSFWANAASAIRLGVNAYLSYGTGGSPSPPAWALATGQATPVLSTTFTRYSFTFAIPTMAGKTLGTNGNDYTGLAFFYSAGSTANVTAGNIGVQSGQINIWGVQLEVGSVATPLEKPDPQQDLAKCQRFYQTGNAFVSGFGSAGNIFYTTLPLPVWMRANPTTTVVVDSNTAAPTAGIGPRGNGAVYIQTNCSANTDLSSQSLSFTASADL
jgi:hypothetical protein